MRRVLSLSAVILLLWVGLALAAAEVVCIVDTDPAAEADYHSLADAIAGETGASPKCVMSADLVANDEQLTIECRASSGAADTAGATVRGFTTDEDNFVRIYVPPAHRHSGVWDDEKYRRTAGIIISNANIRLEGLQILITSSTYEWDSAVFSNSPWNQGGQYVIDCILRSTSSNPCTGITWAETEQPTPINIWNCIIYGFTTRGIYLRVPGRVYNCTVSSCGIGVYGGSSTYVTNCAVFNNTDDIDGSVAITYSAGDETDFASGTGNIQWTGGSTDWAAAFTDYSNGDFSIKNTDSVLYHAGTDLNLTYDIAGNPWHATTPSIGAFEYVDAGGGSKWNGITPAKWNGVDWSNLKWNGM